MKLYICDPFLKVGHKYPAVSFNFMISKKKSCNIGYDFRSITKIILHSTYLKNVFTVALQKNKEKEWWFIYSRKEKCKSVTEKWMNEWMFLFAQVRALWSKRWCFRRPLTFPPLRSCLCTLWALTWQPDRNSLWVKEKSFSHLGKMAAWNWLSCKYCSRTNKYASK